VRRAIAIVFIIASFAIAGLFVYMSASTTKPLTTLDNSLFQIFTLAVGLVGSYLFGKESATENAKELIRPHAKSAFRRVIAIYLGLVRIGQEVQESQLNLSGNVSLHTSFGKLEGMVTEQIATAADALEDWSDIVPDEVKELRQRLNSATLGGSSNEND